MSQPSFTLIYLPGIDLTKENYQLIFSKFSGLRPYDGKWSKSMVGYGPEDDHFVVELTYNYGIKEYKIGNDFQVSHFYSILLQIITCFYNMYNGFVI